MDGNQVVSLDPNVAGAGLSYAAGIVNLGAPSTLSASSSNSAAGATHTHAVAAEFDVSAGASALLRSNAGNIRLLSLHVPTITTVSGSVTLSPAGDVVLTPGGAVRLTDGKTFSTNSFASGFVGHGFRLDQGVSEAGKTTFEVDNLWVRGRMHVYELLIHQIRATNGSIFVSNTSKATDVTLHSGTWGAVGSAYKVYWDTEIGNQFVNNDLIRAQRWDRASSTIYQSNLQVIGTTTDYSVCQLVSGDAPAAGMEFVRVGNTSDTNRQGGVYLTADDSNAPYIDIFNGVNSFAAWNSPGAIKARLGRLSGLSIGSAGEYGLYVGSGMTNADTWLKAGTAGVTLNNVSAKWYNSGVQVIGIDGNSGFTCYASSGYAAVRSYNFHDGSGVYGGMWGIQGAGSRGVYVGASRNNAGDDAQVFVQATNTLKAATAVLAAVSGESASVTVSATTTGATVSLNASHINASGPLRAPDGTVAIPAYSFTDDANSGLYSYANGTIAVSSDGALAFRFSAAGNASDKPLQVYGEGGSLSLVGTTHTYMQIYPDGLTTRRAYIGFGGGASEDLTLGCEYNGGKINLVNITTAGSAYNAANFGFTDSTAYEVNLGPNRNGNTALDLIGDTTYTDYGLRLLRRSGANGGSEIVNRGTGSLRLVSSDAAAVEIFTNAISKLKVAQTYSLNNGITGAISEVPLGLVVISNITTGAVGVFACSGSAGLIGDVYVGTGFSSTNGTANKTNFYFSGGTYRIQNNTGVNCTYYMTIIGSS